MGGSLVPGPQGSAGGPGLPGVGGGLGGLPSPGILTCCSTPEHTAKCTVSPAATGGLGAAKVRDLRPEAPLGPLHTLPIAATSVSVAGSWAAPQSRRKRSWGAGAGPLPSRAGACPSRGSWWPLDGSGRTLPPPRALRPQRPRGSPAGRTRPHTRGREERPKFCSCLRAALPGSPPTPLGKHRPRQGRPPQPVPPGARGAAPVRALSFPGDGPGALTQACRSGRGTTRTTLARCGFLRGGGLRWTGKGHGQRPP